MATPIMQGGIFQQGALPWWLTFKTESDESGAIRYDLYDKTTGQRVIQDQSGAFSYADGTPVPTSLQNSQPSQVSLVSAQGLPQGLVAVKDASGKTRYASALRGDASDYAKITGGVLEGGLLAGRPGGGGTSIAQDASGQQYVVMPEDMTVSRPRPDNAGIMSNFVSGYGPIIAAALPFSGVGSALSGALGMGSAGTGAITGGLNALVTGGDPLKGAAMGGINSLVKSGVGSSFSPTTSTGGAMADWTSGYDLPMGETPSLDSGWTSGYDVPSQDTINSGWTSGYDLPSGDNNYTPSYLNQPAAPAGYTPGGDLPTGDTSGGMGVPSWLSKFFTTPGVAGALVSGAGGLLAANMTGSAAERAAALSAAAGDRATALQAGIYADQQAKQQPFYQAGVNALAKYQDPALTRPFSMADFNADPGYGFRVSEGLKALDRQAAQRGGLISGGALKAATNYGQNAASQEYQNAYNRYVQDQSTQRNTLANIAGFGPPAAAATGSAGTNYATNTGNIGMNTANTNANAGLASTAAQASAYGGIANSLGKALSPDPLTEAITAMMRKQYGVG